MTESIFQWRPALDLSKNPLFETFNWSVSRQVLPGLRIVESRDVEDWSDVRSPSRAARRLKMGHKQRIKYLTVPSDKIYRIGDAMVMHPAKVLELKSKLQEEVKKLEHEVIMGMRRL